MTNRNFNFSANNFFSSSINAILLTFPENARNSCADDLRHLMRNPYQLLPFQTCLKLAGYKFKLNKFTQNIGPTRKERKRVLNFEGDYLF